MKIEFGEARMFRELEPGDVFCMPEGRHSVLLKLAKSEDESEAADDPHDAVHLTSGARLAIPPALEVTVYRKAVLTL